MAIFTTGYRFRDFELQHHLGGGQDGEVWRAQRLSIKSTVAIKFLKAIDHDKISRFEREIGALAALQHPHIITIHHRDETSHPHTGATVPCYVMDYFAGERLDDALRRMADTRARFAACCTYLIQTIGALNAAHTQRITHGDVKPGNILIARDAPTAKLSDFGFALLAGEQRTRTEYPSSSFHAPAQFSAEEADVFDVGKTIEVLLPLLELPHHIAAALRQLAVDLTAVPQRATLAEAITRLQDFHEAAGQASFGTVAVPATPKTKHSEFQDAVHGRVVASARVIALVTAAPFQRLRTVNLYANEEHIYQALNITAFEQAIGDFAAVQQTTQRLSEDAAIKEILTPEIADALPMLALVRYLGTPPYASVLATMLPCAELEALTIEAITSPPISDLVARDWQLSPSFVVDLLFGDRSMLPSYEWQVLTWLTRHPYGPARTEWMQRIAKRLGGLWAHDLQRF
jgi:serine/threonine protein kinase